MIFATDNCPLCRDKLIIKTITLTQDQYMFNYHCKKREIINIYNSIEETSCHYYNRWYSGYHTSTMIMPPFTIHHSEKNNRTSIYGGGHLKKLIFQVPLLDIDYSQPYIVVAKLKGWVIFS